MCVPRLNRTIDEVEVEVTVSIVIKKSTAGSEEFIEESQATSAVGMEKGYARRFRDIDENRFCKRECAVLETDKCEYEKAIEGWDPLQVGFRHKE